MPRVTRMLVNMTFGAVIGLGCLAVNDNASPTNPDSFMSQAQARVGRPLTPMSGAGVARRHYRRGVAVGVGVVGAGVAVRHGYGCAWVIDAYGRRVCQ